MSRLITGAFVALMVLLFLWLLANGRLDEAFVALGEYFRNEGARWLYVAFGLVWGVFAAGMLFSSWQKERLFRLVGQISAGLYLGFLIPSVPLMIGSGELDLKLMGGLLLSGLGMLSFWGEILHEYHKSGGGAAVR